MLTKLGNHFVGMEVALPKCLASHADWGSLSGTGYPFVSLAFASLTNGNYPVIFTVASNQQSKKSTYHCLDQYQLATAINLI